MRGHTCLPPCSTPKDKGKLLLLLLCWLLLHHLKDPAILSEHCGGLHA
jgi:hypothetical protein